MASSSAAIKTKAGQLSKRGFSESSPRTIVGLHKNELKLKKMIETLDSQQNTAVNNIANHQQAMKMSWRRLEERRSTSPLMTRSEKKKKEQPKNRGMMLQSKTKFDVNMTPDIYNVSRPTTVDDSMLNRSSTPASRIQGGPNKPKTGPPPTQLTRAYTSPYLSSPLSLRRPVGAKQDSDDSTSPGGSETKLSDSRMSFSSTSQPSLKQGVAMNSKETLLRASTLMDMKTTSNGAEGFKNFYDRPRTQQSQRGGGATPLSPLMMSQQMENMLNLADAEQDEEDEDTEGSTSELTLAEQFEQIKNCKYIRHSHHYHPEEAAKDDIDH